MSSGTVSHPPLNDDIPERERVVHVLGRQFILTNNYDRPMHGRRIGSVTMDFANGHRDYIRVFGHQPPLTDPKDVVEFERALRQVCEDPELNEEFFGHNAVKPIARWFNPALGLRQRGWGTEPIPPAGTPR